MLATKPFVGLGLISYSLYVWHWPIFAFWRLAKLQPLQPTDAVTLIGVSVLVAFLSWRYFERPFRRGYSAARSSFLFAVAGASLLSIAAIGAVGVLSYGFPQRVSAMALAASAATESFSPLTKTCLRERALDQVERAIPACALGGVAPAKAILWGDSHADAYGPGLAEAAKQLDYPIEQVTMQACNPLFVPSPWAKRGRAVAACIAFNEAVLRRLSDDEAISLVIVAGFWNSSLVHEDNPLNQPDTQETADEATSRKLTTRMDELVAKLQSIGKTVVILGEVPVFPNGGGGCLARAAFLGKSLTYCDVPRAWQTRTVQVTNDALSALAASHHAFFFDPTPEFCNEDRCSAFVQNTFAYRELPSSKRLRRAAPVGSVVQGVGRCNG